MPNDDGITNRLNSETRKSRKYKNVPPDKPLTPREILLVEAYLQTLNFTDAGLKAGYGKQHSDMAKKKKAARQYAHTAINYKPNVRKAVADRLQEFFDSQRATTMAVIKKLQNIALTPAADLIPIKNKRVVIQDTATLMDGAMDLYAGATEKVNDDGSVTLEIKTNDQVGALKTMAQYLGLLDKLSRPQVTMRDQQIAALNKVKDDQSKVVEACLELEIEGIAIPETLRVMLSKNAEHEEDDLDGIEIPTAEAMDKRMQDRLMEIEEQKDKFLPKRQQDVRDIKEELGPGNEKWLDDDSGKNK